MGIQRTALVCFISLTAVGCQSQGKPAGLANADLEKASIFPVGKKITNDNFRGTAYLATLIDADSINPTSIGNVTFEAGARTRWHQHPGGQVLLIIDGVGYYQEKGQAKKILKRGDVIKCPANLAHWHGASPDSPLIQVSVTNRHLGETVWLQDVTDEEYKN